MSSDSSLLEDMLFEVDDYLASFDADEAQEEASHCPATVQANDGCHANKNKATDCNKSKNDSGRRSSSRRSSSVKVAFKTRSAHEILDDGYKWRKYGKKKVKSSPNPRNYYRCSSEGCTVKKRAERHREDSSFVITTYEGVHNHHHAPQPAVLTQHQAVEMP